MKVKITLSHPSILLDDTEIQIVKSKACYSISFILGEMKQNTIVFTPKQNQSEPRLSFIHSKEHYNWTIES